MIGRDSPAAIRALDDRDEKGRERERRKKGGREREKGKKSIGPVHYHTLLAGPVKWCVFAITPDK